jgi:hypothetical protein
MRKSIWLLPIVLFLGVNAIAQNAPKTQNAPQWEIFGGYSHVVADLSNTRFNLDGGEMAVTENVNEWFGGKLYVGAQWGTRNDFNVNSQQIMFGPVFTYRKPSSITPFGHILLGAIRGSQEFSGISQSAYRFATALGGGVDIKLGERASIRAIQADYLISRFMGTYQNNIRLSAGIVYSFGRVR